MRARAWSGILFMKNPEARAAMQMVGFRETRWSDFASPKLRRVGYSSRVQRIGLYGGSFDPIHTGHVLVGQAAIEELQLTRLFFIPAARSRSSRNSNRAQCEQRLAMITTGAGRAGGL
jgi:hypothetical protein